MAFRARGWMTCFDSSRRSASVRRGAVMPSSQENEHQPGPVKSCGHASRASVKVCGMDIRIQCLCVDAAEPRKIASFWEAALGWRRTFDEDDQVCIEPPEGSPEDGVAPDILFLKVPEGK